MKASECRFHAKGKYGLCCRGPEGQKVKMANPRGRRYYFDTCDNWGKACEKAEPKRAIN